jgi:hypothetical protein
MKHGCKTIINRNTSSMQGGARCSNFQWFSSPEILLRNKVHVMYAGQCGNDLLGFGLLVVTQKLLAYRIIRVKTL